LIPWQGPAKSRAGFGHAALYSSFLESRLGGKARHMSRHNDSPRLDGQGAALTSAAGYLRRSTDKQDASIPEQRTAVLKYAAERGYEIVRWYSDDAISGDDTENRPGFLHMRDDAQRRRDFKVILCWNQARFGRFDQIDAGYWIYPIRKAGVRLETVVEGLVDWESPEGQLIYGVNQMGKHKFLPDLSRDVIRGQLEAALQGSWLGSRPYGYRLVGPRKNKRLVLGDPLEVAVVRRIFREYVHEGRSLSEIARRLQTEGVVCPGGPGCKWRHFTVKFILLNPAYAGDFRAYSHSYGKYHQVHGQTITKGGKRGRNPPEDWIMRRDHHEALIDRPTFDQAAVLVARGKTGRSKYSPDENPYVLSGLVRCGKCGGALNGMRNNRGHQYYATTPCLG
jgi:DNA invertase Pin-like site-specific DNA recombinase